MEMCCPDFLQENNGRVGKPGDIAEACLFLSESAGFMTGQNMIIDGGMTIRMIYEE
jgi:NAD(P)-dependent dehydrogenase (short-subunit alcohol dehydrogenase family)